MTDRKAPKSWADEIAELDDPTPKGNAVPLNIQFPILTPPDFDPEAHDEEVFDKADDSNSESEVESEANARDHYEEVGYESVMIGDKEVSKRAAEKARFASQTLYY